METALIPRNSYNARKNTLFIYKDLFRPKTLHQSGLVTSYVTPNDIATYRVDQKIWFYNYYISFFLSLFLVLACLQVKSKLAIFLHDFYLRRSHFQLILLRFCTLRDSYCLFCLSENKSKSEYIYIPAKLNFWCFFYGAFHRNYNSEVSIGETQHFFSICSYAMKRNIKYVAIYGSSCPNI